MVRLRLGLELGLGLGIPNPKLNSMIIVKLTFL